MIINRYTTDLTPVFVDRPFASNDRWLWRWDLI